MNARHDQGNAAVIVPEALQQPPSAQGRAFLRVLQHDNLRSRYVPFHGLNLPRGFVFAAPWLSGG